MPDYTVTIESTLRTATINERFTHSLNTANLPAAATPIATNILAVISNGSLDAKSLQGTISFGALAGRTLGGQATYATEFNNGNAATPYKAVQRTVEPEHRISFAIAPTDWTITGTSSTLNLAKIIQRRIQEGLYENSLYRHGE